MGRGVRSVWVAGVHAAVHTYRGYSKLRTHTVLGPYGRSIRTFLRAVRVLTFE